MQISYVYIIKCNDYSYYVGVTNDVLRRFEEHQNGIDSKAYTFNRRPLELVYFTTFTNIEIAIEAEKKIKKWSRLKKNALIENRLSDLPNLSKKKF